MTFVQAMEAAVSGQHVRRSDWSPDWYLDGNEGGFRVNGPAGPYDFRATIYDVRATWELAQS